MFLVSLHLCWAKHVEQLLSMADPQGVHPVQDWYPTRNNIYRAIQWLMSNQQVGTACSKLLKQASPQSQLSGCCRGLGLQCKGMVLAGRVTARAFLLFTPVLLQPGMSLFFSFSGHGSQKQDYSGDEDDGMDETILPTDFQ
jgi:hypothetical protein